MKPDFQRELQTPGLAAADPSASVRAIELRGKMLEGVVGLAKKGYETYKEYEFQKISQEAEALPREALRRGIEASEAQANLKLLSPVVQGQQGIVRGMEEQLAGEGLSMEQQAERAKATQELSSYVSTAQRLKAASEQGMSPSEYTMRVRALTKNAIEKFPGLAPEIRKEIGSATGMQYADDYAARAYVQQMFSKEDKKKDTKSQERDFSVINKNLGIPMQDIEAAYGTEKYTEYLKNGYDIERLTASANASQAQADAIAARGGANTILAINAMGNTAAANSLIDFTKYQAKQPELFKRLEQQVNSGALNDINKTVAELQIISAEGSAMISKNFRSSEEMLTQKYAAGLLNKENYDKGKTILGDQKTRALAQFAPENMKTVAQILVAHKDKSLADQQKIFATSIEFVKLFGPTELIQSWYGSADDSSNRKKIETDYPQLAAALRQMDPLLKQSGLVPAGLGASTAPIQIGQSIYDAKQNPNPTPVNVTPTPGITEDTKKASLQAVTVEGDITLKRLQQNPTQGVTKQDANLISTMLNNSVEYNQPVDVINNNYKQVNGIFNRFASEDQDRVKSSVASTITQNSGKVIASTGQIDNMFGTQLKIGVRPNGTIGVIPPMDMLRSIQLESPYAVGGVTQRPNFGVFGNYAELKYKSVIPGKEEEFRKYVEASKLWESTQRARANNMVLSKAIVTGEDPAKIGSEIAGLLEAKREVPLFYSSVPVAPPQPAAAATTPATGVPLVQPTVGTLRTEKQAISAAQGAGIEDLKNTISQLKRTLADTKEESPTYVRVANDIAMAEKELSKLQK